MDNFFRKIGWKCSLAWRAGLAVLVCVAIAGCSRINDLRGDGFHDNSGGEAIQKVQPKPKKPQDFWSFSNKARQIEADFPDH